MQSGMIPGGFETGLVDLWSEAGLVAACAALQRRLRADFGLPGFGPITVDIDPSFSDPEIDRAGPRPDAVTIAVGGRRFGAQLARGVELACAHSADKLADDVMDLLGRPWPELRLYGGASGVLRADVDPAGIACWFFNDSAACPVGTLRELFNRFDVTWP
jgi:hypothetical protein